MTKKNAALSKKELYLITLVVVALIMVVLYNYVYTPMKGDLEGLRGEFTTIESDYTLKTNIVNNLPADKAKLEKIKGNTLEIANSFYDLVDQEVFLREIVRMETESGVKVTEVQFQKLKELFDPADLNFDLAYLNTPEGEEPKDAQAIKTPVGMGAMFGLYTKEIAEYWSNSVYTTTYTMTIKGTYPQLQSFIKLVENSPKKIIVSQMVVQNQNKAIGTGDDTEYSTTLTMFIPSIDHANWKVEAK